MKDFGTFDTLTDEEDTIYNRLAAIGNKLDHLDYEQNEAQQEIKMWRNKMLDDKFKVKFWLIIALIFGFFSLPWYQVILMAVPSGADYALGYIMSVIATFIALVTSIVMLPLFIICVIIFFVWLIIHTLRNSKKDKMIKLAENMGVANRNVLIEEQKEIIKTKALEQAELKEEEEQLKRRLDSIRRSRQ